MRGRFIAAMVVGMLALAPAAALADSHESIVRVVHAVDGVDVDVWINGEPALEGFSPTDVAGPLTLPPGDYEIEVYPAGSDPDETDPAITLDATLEGGENLTLVAHRTVDGDIAPNLAVFANDVSTIDAGEARIEVRHTAAAGPVTLSTGDTELGEISLGQHFAADVPAGALPVTVTLSEDGTELLDATLDLADGSYTILHAYIGDDGFTVIPVSIDGLGADDAEDEVHTVPSGEAGLATDALPGWAIGLMALGALSLAAPAAAVARRRS